MSEYERYSALYTKTAHILFVGYFLPYTCSKGPLNLRDVVHSCERLTDLLKCYYELLRGQFSRARNKDRILQKELKNPK
jgi:hypothetical protein